MVRSAPATSATLAAAAGTEDEDCGCCTGLERATPVAVANAPGLPAVAYRTGTHGRFKQSMLAGLTRSRSEALRGLKARKDDDFAIALLDAAATVADVLTFYQERIANESFLRTATERRSVHELARAIGYELRPGVAAEVNLAFTVEGAAGAPGATTIEAGTRVQSVPGPGETAQTFETVEAIPARAAWNAMRPRLTQRHPINAAMPSILVDGLEMALNPGDAVLLAPEGAPNRRREVTLRRVAQVTRRQGTGASLTDVELQPASAIYPPPIPGLPGLRETRLLSVEDYPERLSRFGAPLPVSSKTERVVAKAAAHTPDGGIAVSDLRLFAEEEGTTAEQVLANLSAAEAPPPAVLAFRVRASLFGHNAPGWESLPSQMRAPAELYVGEDCSEVALLYEKGEDGRCVPTRLLEGQYSGRQGSWADAPLMTYLGFLATDGQAKVAPPADPDLLAAGRTLFLDTTYPSVTKGSYVVLQDGIGGGWRSFRVDDVAEVSIADLTLTAKVTRLTLNEPVPESGFAIRSTAVFAQSEQLPLARLPISRAWTGTKLPLDGWVPDLRAGQRLIVCGEPATDRGSRTCEPVTIAEPRVVLDDGGYAELVLARPPANRYVRDTVTIAGNIARATHGETRREVLGSGDAARPYQRFGLRQPRLTYVGAPTATGAASTLAVTVDDVRWSEVPSLFGQGPLDRVYAVRIADNGTTSIQLGDGRTGARLPTGQENVRALYRTGIGQAGLVKAGQLSQLLSRPAGVSAVTNPLAAAGAADPERLDEARRNAPLTVVTLDRVVSLRDYEDFARAFAGVAKALATWTWEGATRGVFLTVAGPDGAEIREPSPVHGHLVEALGRAGDPTVPVRIASYRKTFFRVKATIGLDPDRDGGLVRSAVDAAMHERFSFDGREFGQAVTKGEVIATIQRVPGVASVALQAIWRSAEPEPAPDDPPADLLAEWPQPGRPADCAAGAVLLLLDPRPVELAVLP